MTDVAVLSMQRVNNMGSVLQAYVLEHTIEQFGCSVEFIDIEKRENDNILLEGHIKDFRDERERDGIVGKIQKIDRYFFWRLLHKFLRKKQEKQYVFFRNQYLNMNGRKKNFDICVIGSDEVFNCLNTGDWGFTSQLFGNVPQASEVVTYAASCGTTTYEELPPKVANKIKETFKNVKSFSVRDANTKQFVIKLGGQDVLEHLDPVLIYDFENEMKKANLPKLPEHYCIVYSYRNRIHTKEEIGEIKRFCKKYGLTPIAIGAPQFWIRKFIVCTPFECLKIFKNADFVITDTFHGTIFSVRYAKKYAVMIRESNRNKLQDLINKLEIQQHLLNDMQMLDQVYEQKSGVDRINEVLLRERNDSINFLKENIIC